ncbi:MAG: WecB/TagA/CpsF family glycosyltransferase [Pseudomonadota bacterium]
MSNPFDRDVWAILGMPLDNVTLDEAAGHIERAVETRQRLSFVTPNVNWLVRAIKHKETMRQIVNADLSLADGAPVVWLARQLNMPLKERVAGSDLFDRLRYDQSPQAKPIRIFFFGGREGSAQAAHEVITAEQGRLVAAGWHNPGYGDVESMSTSEIRSKINAAKPDFVIVSLGAAKGQAWIEHNQTHLDAPVIAHLGAVVDFVAGAIRRAPKWLSRIGLEWAWRIIGEPILWRRYWEDGTALLGFLRSRLNTLKRAARVQTSAQPLQSDWQDGKLSLAGDLVLAQRNTLKQALTQPGALDADVILDLSEVRAVDAAGLGQIRMFEQSLMRRGNALAIQASQPIDAALKAASMTV